MEPQISGYAARGGNSATGVPARSTLERLSICIEDTVVERIMHESPLSAPLPIWT